MSNYGLMQLTYGVFDYEREENFSPIPGTETLVHEPGYIKPGFTADDYPPLRLPDPDNIWTTEWTVGGEPALIPGFPE